MANAPEGWTAPPTWQAAFQTSAGRNGVEGVFEIIFHGGGRMQVNTDRGPVRCKGREYNFRQDFFRMPNGEVIDTQHAASIRNTVDFQEPTPHVRTLLTEAARDFAETHWTTSFDAAGELAAADRDVYFARNELEKAQGALATAQDAMDRANERRSAAVVNAPAEVASKA